MAHIPPGEASTDERIRVMDALVSTPHRDLAVLTETHRQAMLADPEFYLALAVHYVSGKQDRVRDHQSQFVAHLLLADFDVQRSAAWVLLQSLSVRQVTQVVRYVKETLKRNPPRSMKHAVEHYLRNLESHPRVLDDVAARFRADLKYLYATFRIDGSEIARALLFGETKADKVPLSVPSWSKVGAVARLAREKDPLRQAQIIVDFNLPYPVAATAFGSGLDEGTKMSAPVLIALINQMTPAEVSNHQAALQRRGAYDHTEVKRLLLSKIERFATDRRTSSLRASKAATTVKQLDADAKSALIQATDSKLARGRRIRYPFAICVDKSSSQALTIAIGAKTASVLSAMADDFVVLFFDNTTRQVVAEEHTLSSWQKATGMIRAHGSTALGSPLRWLAQQRKRVEHVLFLTDAEETAEPHFVPEYQRYVEIMGCRPEVTFLEIGTIEERFYPPLDVAGITYHRLRYVADDYSMPQLVDLLAKGSRGEVIEDILRTTIPQRHTYVQSVQNQVQNRVEGNE